MKATGVVRRIDELGRIVIPKEIRKNLRIHEGENIEIYINEKENIVLKKHSLIKEIDDFAQKFTDSLHSFFKKDISKNKILLYFQAVEMKKMGKFLPIFHNSF